MNHTYYIRLYKMIKKFIDNLYTFFIFCFYCKFVDMSISTVYIISLQQYLNNILLFHFKYLENVFYFYMYNNHY